MRRFIPLLAIVALAALTLPGCSIIFSPEGAENKVREIRSQIADGQFGRVYEEASSQFKSKVKKEDFEKLLSELPEEVGDPSKFERGEGSANYDLDRGFYVIHKYAPVGDSPIEMEEYSLIKEDGEWKLSNYRVVRKRTVEQPNRVPQGRPAL